MSEHAPTGQQSPRPRTKRTAVIVTLAVLVLIAGVLAAVLLLGPEYLAPAEWADDGASGDATLPGIAGVTGSVPATAVPGEVPSRPQRTPTPLAPVDFTVANALADVRALEAFGVRAAGSDAEREAVDYIAAQLSKMGYSPVVIEDVPLPDGRQSHTVRASSEGLSPRTVVLGAHVDSKPPSPGANDNATGCGALLEIARILAAQPATARVEFVFFGAEESIDGNPDHHHYGSRRRVAAMAEAERANVAGMISVDMIGYGPDFVVRTMQRGPQTMRELLLAQARESGVPLTYLKDPSTVGWSDHEPYELAGIPAAWIEWRDDPVYHTAKDTSVHVKPEKVRIAGQLVLDIVRGLDEDDLEKLVAR